MYTPPFGAATPLGAATPFGAATPYTGHTPPKNPVLTAIGLQLLMVAPWSLGVVKQEPKLLLVDNLPLQ